MSKRVNPELSALRALVKQRHRRAGAKISRIANTPDGPIIAGSKHDPRRDIGKINKYNSRQLHAYIRSLNNFIDRSNQYVADAHHKPIKASTWEKYKVAESKLRERKSEAFNKVKKIKLPNGMTIEQFEHMSRPTVQEYANPAMNSPYYQKERKPRSVTSEAALKKLTKKVNSSFTPSDMKRRNAQGKAVVYDMLNLVGDKKLIAEIEGLSERQFSLLWNYSGKFANSLSLLYYLARQRLTDKDSIEDDSISAVEFAAYDEVRQLVEWSKKA